jgi:hypothetical protein
MRFSHYGATLVQVAPASTWDRRDRFDT